MKNIVLCFDQTPGPNGPGETTNIGELFHLLARTDDQVVWYHGGTAMPPANGGGRLAALRWREAVAGNARATVIEAYEFLAEQWQPGDTILVFGGGLGGYCARELTRLLGTVGMLAGCPDELHDYVLARYVLPRCKRSAQDWERVHQLAEGLAGDAESVVPVGFLGLWDTAKVPGLPRVSTEPLANVEVGRHAVAIDGGPFYEPLPAADGDRVEETWFRGAHCDVTGGAGACGPLADIALDWVLDGALHAGAILRDTGVAPLTSEFGALAGSTPMLALRRPPIDALVHASVEVYLRAHPTYWRRLPARIVWADTEWLARNERLMPTGAVVERPEPEPVELAPEPEPAGIAATVS